MSTYLRAATAGKAGKVWSLARFWVSIHSYKKQPVKNFLGRILDLAWLKFAVAALAMVGTLIAAPPREKLPSEISLRKLGFDAYKI